MSDAAIAVVDGLELQDSPPRKVVRGPGRPPKEEKQAEGSFWERDHERNYDSGRFIAYLYRLEPIREFTEGEAKYVAKFNQPIDPEFLKQTYGSGKYRIAVTEGDGKSKYTKQVDSFIFAIEDLNYPPQVPVGDWLDHPTNKKWAWGKAKLEEQQKPAQPQPAPAPAAIAQDSERLIRATADVMQRGAHDPEKVIDLASRAYEKGREQGEANSKGNQGIGYTEMMGMLTTLLQTMKPPTDDKMNGLLMAQMQSDRESARQQIEIIREQSKADREAAERRAESAEKRHSELIAAMLAKKDVDPLEQLGNIAKIVETVQGFGFGGGGNDESWMGVVKDGVRQALPSLMPALVPALASFAGGTRPGAPGVAVGLPTNPAHQIQPPQTNQTQPPPAPADPHEIACRYWLDNFHRALNFINQSRSGLEFGDWIADGDGVAMIEQVKAAGGERLMAALKQHPHWPQIAGLEPRIQTFIGELSAWSFETPDEEDPAEQDGHEVPIGVKARKRKIVQ